jgi:hypothetical protein
MEYKLTVRPFCIGSEKSQATKPLEEAAEAFGQWQLMEKERERRRQGEPDILACAAFREGIIYECCDTIQAACNLMARVGAGADEVSEAMEDVHTSNERRGRYDQPTEEEQSGWHFRTPPDDSREVLCIGPRIGYYLGRYLRTETDDGGTYMMMAPKGSVAGAERKAIAWHELPPANEGGFIDE